MVGIILARMLSQYSYELYQLKFYNYIVKCEMATSYLGVALVCAINKDGSWHRGPSTLLCTSWYPTSRSPVAIEFCLNFVRPRRSTGTIP